MCAAGRIPMPDLDRQLSEANALLKDAGLPLCDSLEPGVDGDTWNPNVIGYAGSRKYAIKIGSRYPGTIAEQCRVANWFRSNRDLPVPEHLCYATDPESLPLLIMEWMAGEQVRLALPDASVEEGELIARDWGRCFAHFHTTQIPDGLIASRPDTAGMFWGDDDVFHEAMARIDAMCDEILWTRRFCERVKRFLQDRRGDFVRDGQVGLKKADMDTRDFLAVRGANAQISAVLDWERVSYGYVLYDCLVAYLRLVWMGRNELWPALCEGYELETGVPLVQSRDVEYCLMIRTLSPAERGIVAAEKIIQALVDGRKIPFEERGVI